MITLITHWILGYPIFGDIRTNPSKPPHQEDATWLETSVTSNSTLQPRQQILSARRCEGACLPLQKWSVLLCVATDQPGGDRPIVTKRGWEIWEPREFGPGDAFFCSPAWFGCICVTNHVQELGLQTRTMITQSPHETKNTWSMIWAAKPQLNSPVPSREHSCSLSIDSYSTKRQRFSRRVLAASVP